MTKVPPPVSVNSALDRIAGQLPEGRKDMAKITNRCTRTVSNWMDPDTPESIPMDCALELEIAYNKAGGVGFPIHEAYTLKLQLGLEQALGDQVELARLTPDIIRETSEATAALAEAALLGATPSTYQAALREGEQALSKLKRGMAIVKGLVSGSEVPP